MPAFCRARRIRLGRPSLTISVGSVVLALALVAASCGGGGSDTTAADAVDGADSFTATQLDGVEFDSASLADTSTVLWFWAPWCTTCRGEAPNVVAAAEELGDAVRIIGVAGRGQVAEMEAFVDDTGTGGLAHLIDDDGQIWSRFGVVTQPSFAFIDADGEVELVVGPMGFDGITERGRQLLESVS
jgi:thiol-disulfide isomerase/thioredoxin